MIRLLAVCLVLCACSTAGAGEPPDGMPRVAAGDVPGLRVLSDRAFDGSALYGYMDGGADLYLEYGFDRLVVQELDVHGASFKIEAYRVSVPRSAFGLFSLGRHRCERVDSLGEFSCISPYLVQFASADLYIRVINSSGVRKGLDVALKIAGLLYRQAEKSKVDVIPPLLRTVPFASRVGDIKFFRGPLGLQNSLPEWSDLFASMSDYGAYVMTIERPEGWLRAAVVSFQRVDDPPLLFAQAGMAGDGAGVLQQSKAKGIVRYARRSSARQVFFIETTLPASQAAPYVAAIEK